MAIKVTLLTPICVVSGMKLNKPLLFPESTKVALIGRFSTVNIKESPSGSEAEILKFNVSPL